MNKHLQPITARVNSGIRKSDDCGCSPAKMDPGTIMKVAQAAGSLGGDKKENSSASANVGSASEGYSTTVAPSKKMKDLSGDGKITRKDVLIGRGVIPAPGKKYGKKY